MEVVGGSGDVANLPVAFLDLTRFFQIRNLNNNGNNNNNNNKSNNSRGRRNR
jgi:hypothetical protein